MRRIAILLTVAATLALGGCKIDDGSDRDIYRPARALWFEVSCRLTEVKSICRCLSTLDAMLSPQWSDIADKLEMRYLDNAIIRVDDKGVYEIYIYDYSDRITTSYRIATGGQSVSADNPWTVICDGNSSETDLILTRDDDGLHLSMMSDFRAGKFHAAEIGLSYDVDTVRARLTMTLDSGRGEIGDDKDNPSYGIVYQIASPLLYDSKDSLEDGEVDIVYDDFIDPVTDRVRVTVVKGFTYFECM